VEVPLPPVTELGLAEPVMEGFEPTADKATVPVKPVMDVTVRVEVPDEPWGMVRDVGLADRAKSLAATSTSTVTGWVGVKPGMKIPLPVAVTVT